MAARPRDLGLEKRIFLQGMLITHSEKLPTACSATALTRRETLQLSTQIYTEKRIKVLVPILFMTNPTTRTAEEQLSLNFHLKVWGGEEGVQIFAIRFFPHSFLFLMNC